MLIQQTASIDLDDYKQHVRDRLDFADLFERTYGQRMNGSRRVFCPRHEDVNTPSMVLYDDHAFCFTCSARLDVFGLLMDVHNCDFMTALKIGGQEAGISWPVKMWLIRLAPRHPRMLRGSRPEPAHLNPGINLLRYIKSYESDFHRFRHGLAVGSQDCGFREIPIYRTGTPAGRYFQP